MRYWCEKCGTEYNVLNEKMTVSYCCTAYIVSGKPCNGQVRELPDYEHTTGGGRFKNKKNRPVRGGHQKTGRAALPLKPRANPEGAFSMAENEEDGKRAESDAALIASLNRYIEALEGKAAAQAELIKELRGRLDGLRAATKNRRETP